MSNRVEYEREIEAKTKEKLKNLPNYMSMFYSRLSANGMQATTKQAYINNCVLFLKYLSPTFDVDLKEINASTIDEYMESITYQGNKKTSPSTRSGRLSALKCFFGFLYDRGIIDDDPTKGIKPPKNNKLNPVVYLTSKEIKEVEKAIREGVGSSRAKNYQKKWAKRDLAIFFLFLSTGVRVEALAEIDLDDIDFKEKRLVVIDKGEKEIVHYLSDSLITYLKDWIKEREKYLNGKEEKALFIGAKRCRFTAGGIRKMIQKYTAVLDKKITPHKLRSTFATTVYQKTKDIYLVSQLVGHENVNTTKRYAACLEDNKKQVSNILENTYFKK